MDINEETYLKERVQNQIDWYSEKSTTNKFLNYLFKILILLISSSIPVLMGFLDTTLIINKTIIGGLGALIAILTGIVSLCKFQEKWTNYRTTSETLKHQKFLFLTKSDPYKIEEESSFNLFVNTAEIIISKENSDWNSFISKKETGKK